jgi:hypothetical protein
MNICRMFLNTLYSTNGKEKEIYCCQNNLNSDDHYVIHYFSKPFVYFSSCKFRDSLGLKNT